MSNMKRIVELEDELLEKGYLKLNKNDESTKTILNWFTDTHSDDYSGIFKGINLDITETKDYYYIELSRENYAKVVKNTMDGLKSTLTDIVDILKDAKEGE